MPEIYSGIFMSGKACIARCGVNALSGLRFRENLNRRPIRGFNAFYPLLPPARPSSRYYRQAALHAHAVWLPGGCFAGVHYRRRDGRWFRQAARPDAWSGRYVYAEDPLPALSPSQCRPLSPRYADLPQTCSTMKRCEPGRPDAHQYRQTRQSW